MKKNTSGFTLLELLSVMAIMVIMMSIAGASYYGMSRGAAMRGSASNLTTTLSLARQFAVNHRNRTHVKLWKDGTNSNYRVFVEAGRNQNSAGNTVLWLENPRFGTGGLKGGDIFNLTRDQSGIVGSVSVVKNTYGMWVTEIKATNNVGSALMTWTLGDKAAWAIREELSLMDGVEFDAGANYSDEVIFNPDGTAAAAFSVGLIETRGTAKKTIHVSPFGKVWATTP